MKRLAYIFLLALTMVSCGVGSGRFKVDGHFLHLNQGELLVYSPDGIIKGIDTIRINGGRFEYEISCEREGTLVLVFPNFSEQPVFVQPGKSVEIKADAANLKEMEVSGTKANKEMTVFRKDVAGMSPPESAKAAERFIIDNPESPVSVYLLRKYFIQSEKPDYDKAAALVSAMLKRQERNGELIKIQGGLEGLKASSAGNVLPSFSCKDINGNTVSNADIRGKVAVISTWASWSYDSSEIQRQLRKLMKGNAGKLAAISIYVDAAEGFCRNTIERDSINWPNICDKEMFESPLVKKLGLYSVPDNIIVDAQGKVVARGLGREELLERLRNMLK